MIVKIDPSFAQELVYFELLLLCDGLWIVAVEGSYMFQESGHVAEAPSLAITFIAYKIVTIGTAVALFVVLADVSSTALATLMTKFVVNAYFSSTTFATLCAHPVVWAYTAAAAIAAIRALLPMFAEGATATCAAIVALLAVGALLADARWHGRRARTSARHWST